MLRRHIEYEKSQKLSSVHVSKLMKTVYVHVSVYVDNRTHGDYAGGRNPERSSANLTRLKSLSIHFTQKGV